MNRGHLRKKMLKGEILARLSHSYGYDDATYDVEHDEKRKFRPVRVFKDYPEKNANWNQDTVGFTDWDLQTKSGWLGKPDNRGIMSLGIHSNLSFEVVEKKLLNKLKKQGLA